LAGEGKTAAKVPRSARGDMTPGTPMTISYKQTLMPSTVTIKSAA